MRLSIIYNTMKTYKNLAAFRARVEKGTDWADYFLLGGRMYNIYEYGPGPGQSGPCYVYFINKRTHDAIKVVYDLPSTQYVDGKPITKGAYRFHELEEIPDMFLWR